MSGNQGTRGQGAGWIDLRDHVCGSGTKGYEKGSGVCVLLLGVGASKRGLDLLER
jgi:hypothetical protein